MGHRDDGVSRRSVLGGMLGGAALAALGSGLGASERRARVIRVESERLWVGDERDPAVVDAMVGAGIVALTGAPEAVAGWRALIPRGSRVGVKINLLGRPFLVTAPEVTDAVVTQLAKAGFDTGAITVWDRRREHFARTGYEIGTGRRGNRVVAGGTYDPQCLADTSGGPVPVDRIVSRETDVTVNLPVLKNHGTAGITGALKNLAFGAYDHHAQAHGGNCDPFIAEACQHFFRAASSPLVVLDATAGCFDGGPRPSDRSKIWRESAIYLSSDPVAVDAVVRDVIGARRRSAGFPDIGRQCRHISSAARRGLGVDEASRIDVVRLRV